MIIRIILKPIITRKCVRPITVYHNLEKECDKHG